MLKAKFVRLWRIEEVKKKKVKKKGLRTTSNILLLYVCFVCQCGVLYGEWLEVQKEGSWGILLCSDDMQLLEVFRPKLFLVISESLTNSIICFSQGGFNSGHRSLGYRTFLSQINWNLDDHWHMFHIALLEKSRWRCSINKFRVY